MKERTPSSCSTLPFCCKRKKLILFSLLASIIYSLHTFLSVHKDRTRLFKHETSISSSTISLKELQDSNVINMTEGHHLKKISAFSNISKKVTPLLRVPSHYSSALVPQIYKRDMATFKKYQAYLAEEEKLMSLQTKVVIILTNYRSGSSFFGELINQHPDVFYFFEPLLLLKNDCDPKKISLKQDILKAVSQCIIPDYEELHKNLTLANDNVESSRNVYVCTKRKFCFAPFTKELCEGRHCPKPYGFNKSNIDCWKDCGVININAVSNECRRKKYSAIKIIRICDINSLQPLVDDLKLDLRVLHLIRDPRGIANSRRILHPNLDLTKSLKNTCDRQAKNAKTGLFIEPDWLKGKYKLFRYEDAALKPYRTAQAVYDFLDLSFPYSLKQWIQENTKLPIPDKSFFQTDNNHTQLANGLNFNKKFLASNRDPWGHARDSKQVVQKWKRQLKYADASSVQEVCKEIMDISGYLPIESENAYFNKNNVYLRTIDNDFTT